MKNQTCDRMHQGAATALRLAGWCLAACCLAVPLAFEPEAAASDLTPTESVKGTMADVIRILENTDLKAPVRAAERRQLIEQVVRDRVSYEEMAKRALGVPWNDLTDEERQEFVRLFVLLLRDTFAGRYPSRW